MEAFVKRMIDEHVNLVVKLTKLENYIYSDKSDKDDKVEFANKCMQLNGMRLYEKALAARLENQNIYFENGSYFEKLGEIKEEITTIEGDDSDNSEKLNKPEVAAE